MQQIEIELKNKYQIIPIAIAAVLAAMVGCVTHFFKVQLPNVRPNTISLFTAAGTLLLYGYDLGWMKAKICELTDAVNLSNVHFTPMDRRALLINVAAISCYILLTMII